MIRCSLANISPLYRRHWAVVTVPRHRATGMETECIFLTDDGREFRAVRGRSVGNKTVFRILATLQGGERLTGRISGEQPLGGFPAVAQAHRWVVDDVAEMVPQIGVPNGGPFASTAWSQLTDMRILMSHSSPANSRFRIDQRLPQFGLHFSVWLDVLHEDPVVPFFGRIVWSDRGDPANLRQFNHLAWRCGEYASFDFSRRLGIQEPVAIDSDWGCLLNSSPVVFGDGVALPISGRLLAFDSRRSVMSTDTDPADMSDDENRSFANLLAGAHGPIVGVCHEWDGNWLAAGNVPRFHSRATALAQAEVDWDVFLGQLQVTAGWFADRSFGLGRMPGQTGNQADFGATKGASAVVAHDPKFVYALQLSAHGDALRGYTHFERDGSMLQADNHPSWVTWSRVTHWHQNVSTDRLGKSTQLPFPSGVYQGVDDEHMSHNYLAAYMALTDDPLMEDQLRHLLETDRAGYRFRYPNNGAGATRAQGRTAGAWAQLSCVADEPTALGFAEILARRFLQTANVSTMQLQKPMRVPCVGQPDPRKQVYNVDGSLGRWTSFWELGLTIVGFAQVVLRERDAVAIEHARECLMICCETMATFGFFEQDGQWFTVADMLWSDGDAPPGGLVNPSLRLTSAPGAGDVMSWTFAGCVAAREFLPRSHPEWDRLNRYVLAITGGNEAHGREAAEWWAIARSIVMPETNNS